MKELKIMSLILVGLLIATSCGDDDESVTNNTTNIIAYTGNQLAVGELLQANETLISESGV